MQRQALQCSIVTISGGGADGSILTFNATELTFPANDGLDNVLDNVGPFFFKYQDVLSPGDLLVTLHGRIYQTDLCRCSVQWADALSLCACPGAPRVKFSLRRPQPIPASPPNLVPEPFDNVTTILARFNSVGFSPQEVITLLSSHTTAGADTVDPTIPGFAHYYSGISKLLTTSQNTI